MAAALLARTRIVADATRRAVANPQDTSQVFRIVEAMAFGTTERLRRRFASSAPGARLLRERDEILPLLSDRAALEAMPEGSLAGAYLAFIDAEGITADGLVAASIEGGTGIQSAASEEVAWLRARMRDTHDLWHVVTGYRGDLLGETSLLAFTFAQTRHPGVGFLAAVGAVLAGDRAQRRLIADGYRRGRRAAWLPAQDWATLLPMPLEEVRSRLGTGAPPAYEPVREASCSR